MRGLPWSAALYRRFVERGRWGRHSWPGGMPTTAVQDNRLNSERGQAGVGMGTAVEEWSRVMALRSPRQVVSNIDNGLYGGRGHGTRAIETAKEARKN